jgi:hypothetical protein
MLAACSPALPMPAPRHAKMTEIVNLKRARKARAKADKDKTAEANRVLYGTPKAVRNLAEARKAKADGTLSGHKLEKPEDDN